MSDQRIFGDGTGDLTQHAARALSSGLAESVLQEAGILPSPTATTMRVVLVDDHVLVREGLASLIEPEPDLQVVGQASSMKQAIALARSLHPDLILMDFELPDGTGDEATRLILAEQSSIKIVFLTVHEDDYRIFRAIAAGATGYLFKRISATELLARLRSVACGEVAMSPATAHRILQEFSHLPSARMARPPVETQLTEREIEIVRQLASGASNREIAKRLVISESTVKNHTTISGLMSRLIPLTILTPCVTISRDDQELRVQGNGEAICS